MDARRLASVRLIAMLAVVELVFGGCAGTRPAARPRLRPGGRTAQSPPSASPVDENPKATPPLAPATAQESVPAHTQPIHPHESKLQSVPAAKPEDARPNAAGGEPPASPNAKPTPAVIEPAPLTPQATTDSRPTDVDMARRLVDHAFAFLDRHPNYVARVTRQERVGNRVLPREVMQMKFRRHPRSVYYQWLDERNSGREVIYVEGQNDGKIISRGGKADFLLNGRVVRVDPNSGLARSKSRYSVHESGMDNMVRRLETVVRMLERADSSRGQVEYKGTVTRAEVPQPLHYLRHTIPLGADPFFPKGGVRHWYFDAESGRFVMMHSEEPSGEFNEYYLFEQFTPSASLSDHDFDPARLSKSR